MRGADVSVHDRAEILGGIWTGSLALDSRCRPYGDRRRGPGSCIIRDLLRAKAGNPQKTYGYLRTEILAARVNAVVLLLPTIYILHEACQWFRSPPEILSGPMLAVAGAGLVVNLISTKLLSAGYTGWTLADFIIGAGIGLFMVPRTWKLLKQAVHILMEGVPAEIDLPELEKALLEIPGVVAVPRFARLDHHIRDEFVDRTSCRERHERRAGGIEERTTVACTKSSRSNTRPYRLKTRNSESGAVLRV